MPVANGLNPSFENVNIGGINISVGAGAPSASLPKGSLYVRTDGSSSSTRLYIATDAVGTWTPVTTTA